MYLGEEEESKRQIFDIAAKYGLANTTDLYYTIDRIPAPPQSLSCPATGRLAFFVSPFPTNFFLHFRHIRVDLLSYKSKTTDKREQYDWRTEKNIDGFCPTS